MPLTPEENEEFIRIRNELTSLKTAFQHICRQVGVEPLEDPANPDSPEAPTLPLHMIPEDIARGIGVNVDSDAAFQALRRTEEILSGKAAAEAAENK